MYKLVLIVAMMTIWLMAHLMQVEEEMAMKTLFQGKHAVNRAAHAAAQQVDKEALGDGIARIDPDAASRAAVEYLRGNLHLDANGMPLERSFLKDPVQVLVFDIVNSDQSFPYSYRNEQYDFQVELKKPGVIVIAKVVFPRAFSVMERVEWNIKGAAELVTG